MSVSNNYLRSVLNIATYDGYNSYSYSYSDSYNYSTNDSP